MALACLTLSNTSFYQIKFAVQPFIIIIIIISDLYSAYYRNKNIGATVKIKNRKLL